MHRLKQPCNMSHLTLLWKVKGSIVSVIGVGGRMRVSVMGINVSNVGIRVIFIEDVCITRMNLKAIIFSSLSLFISYVGAYLWNEFESHYISETKLHKWSMWFG